MTGAFGEYVRKKRLEKGINLRKMAEILGIVPAYMSDIENGRRYPPDKEKIAKIVETLGLSQEEERELYDLAGGEKENGVSPDLPEYIMKTENARTALRIARDLNADEDDWMKVIEMLEAKQQEEQ